MNYKYNQDVIVETKKLEIRESTNKQAGLGVFALEPINAGTIFLECINPEIANSDTIDKKINDLAYKGECSDYDTEENIENNVNVGYIIKDSEHEWTSFFGGVPKIYLYALKNISESEELSRYYGLNYWLEYEFWQRFAHNQYRLTQAMEDLPSDWVFVDEIRKDITFNNHRNLFAKRTGDQYHYFISFSKPNYFDPHFIDKLNDVIVITKDDYSPYRYDGIIYDNMYLTKYLQIKEGNCEDLDKGNKLIVENNDLIEESEEQKKDFKQEFWNKYPECKYFQYNQERGHYGIPIIDDIHPEYVPSTILYKDGDHNLKEYYLYSKKVNSKYYYMLDRYRKYY